jgi:uncharacterized protein involved in exopolysaccharide biosynthesis
MSAAPAHRDTRRLLRTVALTAVAGAVLGAVLSFLIRPTYRAQAVLTVVEQGGADGALGELAGQFGSLALLAGIDLMGKSSSEEALAILRSRLLTEKFISKEGLMPSLYPEKWDEQRKAWRTDIRRPPTMYAAYEKFDRSVRRISVNKATGLITLSIDWRDRNQAAAWTNRLIQYANEEARMRAIREADESLAFLRTEAGKTDAAQIKQSIYRLIEAQIKRRMLASVHREYAFRVLDPAVVPDEDRFVSPRRPLLILLFAVLGAIIGALYISAFRGGLIHRWRQVPATT